MIQYSGVRIAGQVCSFFQTSVSSLMVVIVLVYFG
jgi:hypothetical protein